MSIFIYCGSSSYYVSGEPITSKATMTHRWTRKFSSNTSLLKAADRNRGNRCEQESDGVPLEENNFEIAVTGVQLHMVDVSPYARPQNHIIDYETIKPARIFTYKFTTKFICVDR